MSGPLPPPPSPPRLPRPVAGGCSSVWGPSSRSNSSKKDSAIPLANDDHAPRRLDVAVWPLRMSEPLQDAPILPPDLPRTPCSRSGFLMAEAARQTGPALFPSGVVCDRFRIDGVLGVGGTGTVFRALDLEREEIVALKAIPHDATLRQRARREASVAGKLRHPNVVRLRSVHEDGQYVYIASDIVEGMDLAGRAAPGPARRSGAPARRGRRLRRSRARPRARRRAPRRQARQRPAGARRHRARARLRHRLARRARRDRRRPHARHALLHGARDLPGRPADAGHRRLGRRRDGLRGAHRREPVPRAHAGRAARASQAPAALARRPAARPPARAQRRVRPGARVAPPPPPERRRALARARRRPPTRSSGRPASARLARAGRPGRAVRAAPGAARARRPGPPCARSLRCRACLRCRRSRGPDSSSTSPRGTRASRAAASPRPPRRSCGRRGWPRAAPAPAS